MPVLSVSILVALGVVPKLPSLIHLGIVQSRSLWRTAASPAFFTSALQPNG